ncbi:ABC transporter ATP-binding protein [Celeribacter baekdonensis]|uniref:Spermidine/putrescine import ATP-binding protein PotA n=1 Tax=Celeribacter baekdonensis TaxID=875171 RepID=A0A2R4M590_9RHOB|nr:ABC transporter ATP-binding protein [Celeribacter baekdonensis]AVW92370.1 Fe3+/spermidine/putrescine ABC transporter ATP-binding protein [Celeribacter baekdonensis]|tara:strand:+ start:9575 stop:10666 length:1092 start_codon:yes stop_codon:yes gene_type:complete
MPPVIELSNISKHYGTVVGVDHVDLKVQDGEFLTLLGPSGCGKSTLLRMIGGFETPTSGLIKLSGQDVTYMPPQKRDVNMMFQDYALFPHMSVGQNIMYGLKMKGIGKADARRMALEALDLVGLPDKIDQRPNQLSGGQQQRIALARAIVRHPKVLLLDEPLSALDANLREQMQVELKHLHDKIGITFIMVTHDQTEALVMSDRVVVMQKGVVAQDGTPQDLYENPMSSYVANFIGTTNFLPAKLVSQSDGQAVVEASGQTLTVAKFDAALLARPIQIGLRPEKLRFLFNSDSGAGNVLTGTVAEHIYYGLGLRSLVRLDGGQEVLVDALLPSGMARSTTPALGATVRLGIDAEAISVFEKES